MKLSDLRAVVREKQAFKERINKDFFSPTEKHLCRFCGTPIARLVDGKLFPLGNKAHATVTLKSGAFFRFNGCADCIKDLDLKNLAVCDAIYESEPAVERSKDRLRDRPVVSDMCAKELSPSHTANLKELIKRRNSK